jgi:(1->4)-alpha-D-glucan 1-alpha-D-glucosylmutase
MNPGSPPLTATYRVQLSADFNFSQAREIVPYLERLGISHLYSGPILTPRHASSHGYDVADPTRVNAELGGESGLRALATDLHARSMGLIVDIVPNHMGVGADNPFWDDLLAHGRRSRFAHWFDVDWGAGGEDGRHVVLPVLDDERPAVIARGDLGLRIDEHDGPRIVYRDLSFPIDPATSPPELQLAQFDPAARREAIALFANERNGGSRMAALLDAQHFRLVAWRADAAPNYRRFFDVNDLVSLRMHDPLVFEETHALLFRLIDDGVIDGVRVDHVDGLRDPATYLGRLRDRIDDRPIFVEKILSGDERLRASWPVQGTTGYEFLADLDDLFIDPAGAAEIERGYRNLRKLREVTFRSTAHEGKRAVLRGPLSAEVARLAASIAPLARDAGAPADDAELADGIVELIAALPVYRTYIDPSGAVHPDDRAVIERAMGDVGTRHVAGEAATRFVTALLLGTIAAESELRASFVSGFQQLSGPAAAKGVEDTALYVYSPLIARNEVGGSPARALGDAAGRLHESAARRALQWPLSLTCTNTHDTKRSGDVRSRLVALSEMPREWNRAVRRWRRLNAKHRVAVNGRLAPDTNTEYLLYQTLIALWPTPRGGRRVDDLPDRTWRDAIQRRLVQYMLKAVREAKTRTSWSRPDARYEEAVRRFTGAILEPSEDAPFLPDVARLVSRLAPVGAWNALARLAVHLTAPGTPDVYQGDEFWNYALVDPDNRRPVDYAARGVALDDLRDFERVFEDGSPLDLGDPRLKLFVTSRLLLARRSHPELFTRGSYTPLKIRGPKAQHIFAHAREFGGKAVVVAVPRLSCELVEGSESCWLDTAVELPNSLRGRPLRPVIAGKPVVADSDSIPIQRLLDPLPIGVLVRE